MLKLNWEYNQFFLSDKYIISKLFPSSMKTTGLLITFKILLPLLTIYFLKCLKWYEESGNAVYFLYIYGFVFEIFVFKDYGK